MRPRRYLTFSLRTFFIVLTVLAVWLGVIVNRAREQREAVKAIEALGGCVIYDWQVEDEHTDENGLLESFSIDHSNYPPKPDWLRQLIGDDFFQNAEVVFLDDVDTEANVLNAVPHLQKLRAVKVLSPPRRFSAAARAEFKASVPICKDW